MKKMLFFWEELKSTFWFVPILILTIALCLSAGLVYLDVQLKLEPGGFWGKYLFSGSADSAHNILGIIAGAMIGVAGTVFSITLVALTLASSQFGPRLVKNFMYDRINQVVLGAYISTFIYCLIVLNTIKENNEMDFIPVIAVLFAILLAIGNIILLIVFIHHVAVSIQADQVVSNIHRSLTKHVQVLFPEEIGEDGDREEEAAWDELKSGYVVHKELIAPNSGYLQYVDGDSLMELAVEMDWGLELPYRPGNYLVKGQALAKVHAHEKLEEGQFDKLRNCFIVGESRTQQQDAEYSIHQMVEIAARALSPGVNDPFTAISCIDNLTSTICYLSKVRLPHRMRYDEQGKLRIMTEVFSYEGMFDAAFNQIRQFAKGSPSVMIRLMEAFITISQFAHRPYQREVIEKHAQMVLRLAEKCFEEPNDLKDLKERSKVLLA